MKQWSRKVVLTALKPSSTSVGCWSGAPPGALHAQPVNAARYNKPFGVSTDGALSLQSPNINKKKMKKWSRSPFHVGWSCRKCHLRSQRRSLQGCWSESGGRKASHDWLGERGTSLWRAACLVENTCSPDKDIAQTPAILEGWAFIQMCIFASESPLSKWNS